MTKAHGIGSGAYVLEYNYTGGRHFAIWLHSRRGRKDLLVNDIGKLKGRVCLNFPKDDVVWFEVDASFGNWEFTLERKR